MSDAPDPAPTPPSPPRLLEYQTPRPRQKSPVNAAWVRFMVGVGAELAAIVAMDQYSSFHDSPVMIVIVMVLSGSLFLLADAVRRTLPRQTARERRAWFTIAIGAVCMGLCEVVHLALLGHTATLGWVVTVWVIAIAAAPFAVYSSGQSD